MKFLQANRIAQNGTPRSAASHLGLFCLPMSHKMDARLILVKIAYLYFVKFMRGSRNFHERGSNENGNFWSQTRGAEKNKITTYLPFIFVCFSKANHLY